MGGDLSFQQKSWTRQTRDYRHSFLMEGAEPQGPSAVVIISNGYGGSLAGA